MTFIDLRGKYKDFISFRLRCASWICQFDHCVQDRLEGNQDKIQSLIEKRFDTLTEAHCWNFITYSQM